MVHWADLVSPARMTCSGQDRYWRWTAAPCMDGIFRPGQDYALCQITGRWQI